MAELLSRAAVCCVLAGLWLAAAHRPPLYAPIGVAVHLCIAAECATQLWLRRRWLGSYRAAAVLVAAALVLARYGAAVVTLPRRTVLTLIAVCAVSDAAQYAVGRSAGTVRLGRLSPNKTVEGYLGGLAAVCAVAPLVGWPAPRALLVYGAGVAGDLGASGFKRTLGIDKFSRILGEHGGVSDRLDSFIGAVVLLSV